MFYRSFPFLAIKTIYYVVGFLLFVVLPNGFIFELLTTYTGKEHIRSEDEPHRWRAKVLGILERSMYFVSWLVGFPEFIGLWLVFKAADRWSRMRSAYDVDEEFQSIKESRQAKINAYIGNERFLIGSGLSIVYGVMGGIFAQQLPTHFWLAYFLLIGIILASYAFYIYVYCEAEKNKPEEIKKPLPISKG